MLSFIRVIPKRRWSLILSSTRRLDVVSLTNFIRSGRPESTLRFLLLLLTHMVILVIFATI